MNFFVTCAKGTEGPLRRELVALRIRAPRGDTGGVSFAGSFQDAMKVCLWSRVAMRVYLEIGTFRARDAESLYAGTRAADWGGLITPATTIAVTAVTSGSSTIRHSGFAALKVKDAVVDAVRDHAGTRPSVAADDPDVALFLHLRGEEARLYADLAGEPLHRRGYRRHMAEATLKENLAAAILALGGVSASATLFDPMTGSGTFAIEHALAARNVAPGLGRRFGFERWPDRGDHLTIWDALRREAQARALPSAPACIVARDVSRDALAAARRNADAAGVATDITFEVADVASPPPVGTPPGSCVINPPYGERLPSPEELNQRIGGAAQRWLQDGWRVAVLSGTPALERALPGRPRISHKLWNGALETRLLVYS